MHSKKKRIPYVSNWLNVNLYWQISSCPVMVESIVMFSCNIFASVIFYFSFVGKNWINYFYIFVTSSFELKNFDKGNSAMICTSSSWGPATGDTRSFECDPPVAGRYVTIYLFSSSMLVTCEVEVFILVPGE